MEQGFERVVSFADLWQICKESKRKIVCGAIAFACLAGLYSLTQSVEYEAQATFREKTRSQSGINTNSLSSLIFNANSASSSEAISMLKSRKILERVIKETGLQASVTKQEFRFNTLGKIRDNVIAELAVLRGRSGSILSEFSPDIAVQGISYAGDLPLTLKLEFSSEDTFDYKGPRNIVGAGKIGIPIVTNEAEFTVVRNNEQSIQSERYTLSIQPMRNVAQSLLSRIKIATDRDDKSLLKLKYVDANRVTASKVLNTLMEEYQKFLNEEQQHILQEQVGYLEGRHDRMQQHLQKMMEEYAVVLTSDVTSIGFPDSNKAMDFLAMRQSEYSKDILSLDLDHKRLETTQHVGVTEKKNILGEDPFQGLNLATAKELYVDYNKQLNTLEGEILQQHFILDQIKDPEFEVSSLSTILNDSVSNEMVSKASTLLLSLRDQRNRSARDQERLKNELDVQKGFLALHLKQTMQLLELRQRLLQEKITTLLEITKGLIKQERAVLEQHQEGLQLEMAKLPKKWVSQRLIDQQMEMNKRMVEEITKLVETKNITSNLELIQSAPVDIALVPLKPRPPYILLFTGLGAFVGAFLTLAFAMVQSIRKGIKVTEENLRLAGQKVLGTLSMQSRQSSIDHDHDLALFRRIILFLEKTKDEFMFPERDAVLVIGQGPDYSPDLARVMAKKGLRVLLMPLFFDNASMNDKQGLLSYLEGKIERPAIQKMGEYDILPSGGICRYADEYIGSRRFIDLLHNLKENYDWVIAVSHAEPNSAQAEQLMRLFGCSVITLSDKKWHELDGCLTVDSSRARAWIVAACKIIAV